MKQETRVRAATRTGAGAALTARARSAGLSAAVSAAFAAALSLGVFAAAPAHAADTVDAARATMLANSNACMGCHTIKRKMVGPSFDDITARYKTDPDAVEKLGAKIIKGGAGAWGMIPMPSHPAMSKTDAQTIAAWIMAGSPPAK